MNWWISNIYPSDDLPSGGWEREWIDIVRGSENITDEKLVNYFINRELDLPPAATNRGIYKGLDNTVEKLQSSITLQKQMINILRVINTKTLI